VELVEAIEMHLVGAPAGVPAFHKAVLHAVSPAAATSVGNQSSAETISFETAPA
jgi:hypothetical protein